jgi:hypothetical protein
MRVGKATLAALVALFDAAALEPGAAELEPGAAELEARLTGGPDDSCFASSSSRLPHVPAE